MDAGADAAPLLHVPDTVDTFEIKGRTVSDVCTTVLLGNFISKVPAASRSNAGGQSVETETESESKTRSRASARTRERARERESETSTRKVTFYKAWADAASLP